MTLSELQIGDLFIYSNGTSTIWKVVDKKENEISIVNSSNLKSKVRTITLSAFCLGEKYGDRKVISC